jgi:hypothetical protein
VRSQLKIVQIQHTYVISSQKIKKKELFVPTLLRNFPLKKSHFLGIFKNVLTGFYCISHQLSCCYAHTDVCSDNHYEPVGADQIGLEGNTLMSRD